MTKNTGVGRGNNPQSHKNTKRGADHCRWNSQQIISSHGYVKVRVGIGHQLADPNGYAYEHLVVWSAAGRTLPTPEQIIHHRNEDKTDNRLSNLELLTRPEHAMEHHKLGHATDTAPRGHHTKRKAMSAIISPCGQYRYRLERTVAMEGPVYAFFGINPSTADASLDDATVRKWIGFTKKWGGSRFIVGNVFAFRATDVKALASVDDPYGPDIGDHITSIIEDADILVPCWGNTTKVPPQLQDAFDVLMDALVSSGKPVRHFGQTNAGDPKHPLMLAYDTPLLAWGDAEAEEA